MGALHEGHLSLVRRSRAENDRTLVSIFVNPTQFDDPPIWRAIRGHSTADLAALRAEGARLRARCPPAADLYPDQYRFRVTGDGLSTTLEGAHRPGHFEGVLTVVLKLLQIASADRAYFGEKDWQQLTLSDRWSGHSFCPRPSSPARRSASPTGWHAARVTRGCRGRPAHGRRCFTKRSSSASNAQAAADAPRVRFRRGLRRRPRRAQARRRASRRRASDRQRDR